jgi:Kef-type K+ transport system membrane component KefB
LLSVFHGEYQLNSAASPFGVGSGALFGIIVTHRAKKLHSSGAGYWSNQQHKTHEVQHPSDFLIGPHLIDQIRQSDCAVTDQVQGLQNISELGGILFLFTVGLEMLPKQL